MRAATDFSCSYAAVEDLEKELDIVYNGPGLYLETERTILITVFDTEEGKLWSRVHAKGKRLYAAVWTCGYTKTILPYLANAPIRNDERKEDPEC